MFVLNIIWTTDLFDEKDILSPKMIGCSIANELFGSGIDISFICSSETSSAALTASLLSKELFILSSSSQSSSSLSNNIQPIYVFPYINCPYTIEYHSVHKLQHKGMKFLKQCTGFPIFYKNRSNSKHFETFIIPLIKKLLWTTHNLYKNDTTDKTEYNVLIVSHPYFIEDTFGLSIKKGETIKQTYTYKIYTDEQPVSVECNKPISCHKWRIRNTNSPKFEDYRKIFLITPFTL